MVSSLASAGNLFCIALFRESAGGIGKRREEVRNVKRPAILLVGFAPSGGHHPADHLERRGFIVEQAGDLRRAFKPLEDGRMDVAVLGPGLPAAEALDLLRSEAGRAGAPLFLLVSRAPDLIGKVLALELGAADIVEADIAPRELAARISRLVARRGGASRDLLMLENSTVDLGAALAMHRSGREEQLSPGQVALLRLFVSRPSAVLTREELIAAAPAEDADAFDRSIDSRIARLRRKLDTEAIATVRGLGYRFDPV